MSERNDSVVLMNSRRVERALKRMAYQIIESVDDQMEINIVGINTRGKALGNRLSNLLREISELKITCQQLDMDQAGQSFSFENDTSPDKRFVLMVDDVIFSGRTMFKALQVVTRNGIPGEMHCAVLVDRGHRNVPVEAKYVGLSLPTKLQEHVSVEIADQEKIKEVKLHLN